MSLISLWPTQISITEYSLDSEPEFAQGWQAEWSRGSFLPELQAHIKHKVNSYFEQCGFTTIELAGYNVWLNEKTTGQHTIPHSHGLALVGWCYYISSPDPTAPIVFLDPKGNNSWDSLYLPPHPGRSPQYEYLYRHQPKKGDLIIFPGWLTHYVEPNPSTHTRISLAGEYHAKSFVEKLAPASGTY